MRRFATVVLAAGLMAATTLAAHPASPKERVAAEWPNYGGDGASSRYSSLAQIDRKNFRRLKIAWTWRSAEEPVVKANPQVKTWAWECTPLMVGGVLYVSTSLSQVAALDAATGKALWVYDPESWKAAAPPPNHGFVHRGVAYWADGTDRRILLGTGNGYLVCLDAATGKPVPTFGAGGRVDLTQGLGRPVTRELYGVTSPPVICRDVVAIGASILDFPLEGAMPPGDIRGFDVRTGRQRWLFRAVPAAGEFGNETWLKESWKTAGGANVWTMMSADEALGAIYLPFGTPADDFYGGHRPGTGLFGESLVCLDAETGRRRWHFQMVHHGLWDYDLPAAPNLVDIQVDGRRIRAVAQVSKQGFCYVLDRATGQPVWPIEERPVPPSSIPGEQASPTQPFPTRPAAFDRQGLTKDDLIDFTPELRRAALAELEKYTYGPLFTPPSLEKPTVALPGVAGGASWAGAACDPETGVLYVPSVTIPFTLNMVKTPLPHAAYLGVVAPLPGVQDLPLCKPPYARLTAIDLNSGAHRWQVPLGDLARTHPTLRSLNLPPTGRPARGHVLLTKTLLIVGQEGTTQRASASPRGYAIAADFESIDPGLSAFDKKSGKVVGEVPLPRNVTGAPMTCMLNGRQYIIVATGGANLPPELIALRLP